MPKKSKKALYIHKPKLGKTPRIRQSPASFDRENFVWRVNDRYIDYEHPKLGWTNIDTVSFLKNIVKELQSYEGLTWNEVKNKRHCHSQEVQTIPTELQARLRERNLDLDELFQINIGSVCRLWGYRDRKTFYLIWYDSKHEVLKTKAE